MEWYLALHHGCSHACLYLLRAQNKDFSHFLRPDRVYTQHMGRRRDWWLSVASVPYFLILKAAQYSLTLLFLTFKWKCWKDNFYPFILIHFNLILYFATLPQLLRVSPQDFPLMLLKCQHTVIRLLWRSFLEKKWSNFISIHLISFYHLMQIKKASSSKCPIGQVS